MTKGGVTRTRKPLVSMTILDSIGVPHTLPVVLDTAFTGELVLPERYVRRFALTMNEQYDGRPATGDIIEIPAGQATIIWRGRRRNVKVLQLGVEALLGMEFLWNHRITIDAVADGAVSITPLIKDRMGG